jgi:MoxR-like ATPase
MRDCVEIAKSLLDNVSKVIYGKDDQIRLMLSCWFAGGNLLIEDMPGTGKTMLARALAKSAGVDFQRIQFTPDLLPGDISGTHIFDQKTSSFVFHKGPLLTTLVLADEINRATPRTQSALLEAMGEGQVTVDGSTHKLDPLFFVIATQNPVEQMGTFPLPEAQLDRFMIKMSMGYPTLSEEIKILKNQNISHPINEIQQVCTSEDLVAIRQMIPQIKVSMPVYEYAVNLVIRTRNRAALKLGASPRASYALVRAAQAIAFMEGLDHVRPSHIQKIAHNVLDHRVMPTVEAMLQGETTQQIVTTLIHEVQVPVGL